MAALNGRTIGVLESRRGAELTTLVRQLGGTVVGAPAVQEIERPDDIGRFTDLLITGGFDVVAQRVVQRGDAVDALGPVEQVPVLNLAGDEERIDASVDRIIDERDERIEIIRQHPLVGADIVDVGAVAAKRVGQHRLAFAVVDQGDAAPVEIDCCKRVDQLA